MAPRVILVPFPITPLAAFEYFLLRRLGRIGQDAAVRFRATAGTASAAAVLGNGAVYHLLGRDPDSYLQSLFPDVPPDEKGPMKRLLSYCVSGDPQRGHRLHRWLIQSVLAGDDPTRILTSAAELFDSWLADGVDPWRSAFNLPKPDGAVPSESVPYPPDKRYVTLPVFKSREPGEKEVIAAARRELAEGRIYELRHAHIGLAIGGPPGSGKSTLIVSLATEFANIIASLKSRRGWEGFSLGVAVANLDLATPTVDAIAAGTAKDRGEALRLRKQPWTEDLALQALEAFVQTKARANIVLADLPGKISPLTEMVAAPADVAILITREWSHMPEWQEFAVRRMGLALVSRARSRYAGEEFGFTSVVTRYQPGEIIAGRVVGLDRVDRSWDRFVSWLAEFLLFDILPSFVTRRREKLQRLLTELGPP